jgi:hypothetical protein
LRDFRSATFALIIELISTWRLKPPAAAMTATAVADHIEREQPGFKPGGRHVSRTLHAVLRRAGRKIHEWSLRYLPAEGAGILTAAAAGVVAYWSNSATAVVGVAAALGEAIGYYGWLVTSDLMRRHHDDRRGRDRPALDVMLTLRDLVVEFGPAEAVDTLLVRPALYVSLPILLGGELIVNLFYAKLISDAVFYLLAVPGYELRNALFGRSRTQNQRDHLAPH